MYGECERETDGATADTQHEAAIEAAAKALEQHLPPAFVKLAKGRERRKHWLDYVAAAIAAYDAARSGEREDDREWIATGEQAGAARAGETMWQGPHLKPGERVTVVPKSELERVRAARSGEAEGLRDALIFARSELHRAMLERRSTVGYRESFARINAALAEHPKPRTSLLDEPACKPYPEPRRYSADHDGREAVSGADLAQAIDGVPHEPRQDQPVDREATDDDVNELIEMPRDLLAVLRDPSIIIRQDAAVFELIAKWQNAPSPTMAGQPVDRASGERITHGRHCICSACAREDWTNPALVCGMHGRACPNRYAPLGAPGDLVQHPETGEREACPDCDGKGDWSDLDSTDDRLCGRCKGSGKIPAAEPLQDGGEREQRLIEIIVGPCSRTYFDAMLVELSALMQETWPQLGPAVAGQYSLAERPHQAVEPRPLTLTRREIGALLAAGNLSYQSVTLLVEEGPGSIDLTNRSEAEVERREVEFKALADHLREALGFMRSCARSGENGAEHPTVVSAIEAYEGFSARHPQEKGR